MFKVIKILGAKCNAPEIVGIDVELSGPCEAGQLYFFDNYSILPHTGAEFKNIFIPIENKEGDGSKIRVKGYYVSGDMVFETKVFGKPDGLFVGSEVSAHVNDENVLDGVSVSAGTFARIVSIEDYESTGKVAIRIIV